MAKVTGRSSSRRVFRWECSEVELIPVPVEISEYSERVARVAQELYSLLNQLHGQALGRSDSLIHPGETLEPKAATHVTVHEGVCDGTESIQEAA